MKPRQYKISVRLAMILFGGLLMVFIILLMVTRFFLPNYYLFQVDKNVDEALIELKKEALDQADIEQAYGVTVVRSNPDKFVLADLNDDLLLKLNRKGIALSRFWLTQESLDKLVEGSQDELTINYDQPKQKSAFLAKITLIDQQIVIVGTQMVHFSEAASIMTRFFFISLGMILLGAMVVIYFMARHLLKPLLTIKESAEKIAALEYVTIPTYPPNELGDLAQSINTMSDSLQKNQERLTQQNQQIRQLTADLTHELKTPIAIIQAYAAGIEDGIDDGTYLQIILKQVAQLDAIVSDMLRYSKLSQLDFPLVETDVKTILSQKISELTPLADMSGKRLDVAANFEWQRMSLPMLGNSYLLSLVFDNLLSNSIRYASSSDIQLFLEKDGVKLVVRISNDWLDEGISIEQVAELWQPFVVGADSRNKSLAGTGLGLAIVDNALNQLGARADITIFEQRFTVSIHFNLLESAK